MVAVPVRIFAFAMGIQGEFFERPADNRLSLEDSPFEEIAQAPPMDAPATTEDFSSVVHVIPGNGASRHGVAASRRTMKDLSIPKLYYSISEVSRLTGLEPYVLRYWESEFDELRPQKNRAGNRIYSNRDIQFILRIKELLREQRYTIEGAKHILKHAGTPETVLPEDTIVSPDPAQIPLTTPTPPVSQAALTLDEIHSMKDALLALRDILKA
jgi:DNA-binding transcriptional MerR regulator